jgi:amino acid adenylation domain-containing protein
MGDNSSQRHSLPLEQQVIRDKCFHPSGTFVEFSSEEIEQSIPTRFETIARRCANRVAIQSDNQKLTYAELNEAANKLARSILSKQSRLSVPIAVLVGKGVTSATAILAVLKTGRPVVLLDPLFPKARTATIMADSEAALLLVDEANRPLGDELARDTCEIFVTASVSSDASSHDLDFPSGSQDLAFILYTSGSTGQPKGVTQTHRNILHNLMIRMSVHHVSEHDRVSLLASGTSNSLMNMFLAILTGATLLPFDVLKDGVGRLASWLAGERISICLISGPLFRAFCESLSDEQMFPDLRVLNLNSEAVYPKDVGLYKKHFSKQCIFASGLATSETGPLRKFVIDHESDIAGTEVPVGYPVDDKEILILDDEGRNLGFDAIGEIVVRSRYLSPGYWNRPELNATKFRPDPTGGEARFYFTGDMGIIRPDGCLIHKGRKDFRVKIRGYGVETAEVERVLVSHPAIRECYVIPQISSAGEVRLVAYFTTGGSSVPSATDLRLFLKATLAEYMMPSAFVPLESIPLTAAGKLDRAALPGVPSRRALNTTFVAPRSPTEEMLAKIWSEVLGIDQIGVHDDFFDLGGHSLAATRIVAQVIRAFEVNVPMKALFDAPSIAEMAGIITVNQISALNDSEVSEMLRRLEEISEGEARQLIAAESAVPKRRST